MIIRLLFILSFVTTSIDIHAQHNFDFYENNLSANCGECSSAEMNEYLLQQCKKRDELISKKLSMILEKITLKYSDADSIYRIYLDNARSSLFSAHNSWLQLTTKAVDAYSSLGEGGTVKNVYYGLMYLMLADQHLQYLSIFELTAFGS